MKSGTSRHQLICFRKAKSKVVFTLVFTFHMVPSATFYNFQLNTCNSLSYHIVPVFLGRLFLEVVYLYLVNW